MNGDNSHLIKRKVNYSIEYSFDKTRQISKQNSLKELKSAASSKLQTPLKKEPLQILEEC